jgi:hypothetical protein
MKSIMKYSTEFTAVLSMFALPFLVNLGFSDACSSEIVTIFTPMLPGAYYLLKKRFERGGVNVLGIKK